MKKELKERWIAALESGEYEKGKDALCCDGETYCCLGVLAQIEGRMDGEFLAGTLEADDFMVLGGEGYIGDKWFGLDVRHHKPLIIINDDSSTFAPVIEYIKENVEVNND